MQVEIFTLCEEATSRRGRLDILGAFDTIASDTIPATVPHFAVVARVRFKRSEQGEHHIRVNFVDADGNKIAPSLGGTKAAENFANSSSCALDFITNTTNQPFPKCGEYSIDLIVDGHAAATLPLFVVATQEAWAGCSDTRPRLE